MIKCNPTNYDQTKRKISDIKYIVLHYTGVSGQTALDNAHYFANNKNLNASAHYFVDEKRSVQSVPITNIAWHCGGKNYKHKECRNANSIGIELCFNIVNNKWVLPEKTMGNLILLLDELREAGVDVSNIVRHYDVTGKTCPAPWVDNTEWEKQLQIIKKGLTNMQEIRYNRVEDIPEYAQEAIQWLIDEGVLSGKVTGLDLSNDMVRVLTIIYRLLEGDYHD